MIKFESTTNNLAHFGHQQAACFTIILQNGLSRLSKQSNGLVLNILRRVLPKTISHIVIKIEEFCESRNFFHAQFSKKAVRAISFVILQPESGFSCVFQDISSPACAWRWANILGAATVLGCIEQLFCKEIKSVGTVMCISLGMRLHYLAGVFIFVKIQKLLIYGLKHLKICLKFQQ